MRIGIAYLLVSMVATAFAQTSPTPAAAPAKSPVTLSNDKPVEVSSNTLDVVQDQHIAIFTGNVIATQGLINMRADKMIVHYINGGDANGKAGDKADKKAPPKPKPPKEPKQPGAAPTNGISQIDSFGHVIFTNPTDTAKGDFATYNVAAQTLDLTGKVILTRDKNILNGTHMHYDLATSRSVLTAGNVPISDTGATVNGGGRVHGLFVPNAKPKPGAATGASTNGTTNATISTTPGTNSGTTGGAPTLGTTGGTP